MKEHKKRNDKIAYSEGWFSVAVNIFLFIIKYKAGVLSGSVALISDAWHSLSDSVSSLAVIAGTKISSKPPDERHPFGHGRAELVTSLIIGMLLVLIAFNFLKESVESLIHEKEAVFGTLSVVVLIISVLMKELSAQYAFYTARKTGMLSLKADGWHHRSDAITSVLILAGIFINPYFPYIDGILGIIVSLFIFYSAYSVIKESAGAVLGEACDENLISEIKKISDKTAKFDVRAHNFRFHNYVNHKEITFHIFLPGNMKVKDAHDIAEKIERNINNETGLFATVHVDAK